jgi:hypothetical protein
MMSEDDRPVSHPVSRIPDFQSLEEEAAYWDTHDFTEFLDETRPVKLRVRARPATDLTYRLNRQIVPESE